jgi:endonuclease/exonuclease/phosphatase family metal-dependent hydrolase
MVRWETEKNRKLGLVLCSLLLWGCGSSAPGGGKTETLKIVTWNVQALFDGDETGTEYAEYREASGWNREKYSARETSISQSLNRLEYVPDILALQEVENSSILEKLAGTLSNDRYWTFFANNRDSSLGIGIISRFPFTLTKIHSAAGRETLPRPVLEVRIEPEERPLTLFVCHWKSKLGGEDATEPLRRTAARIILRRIREIRAETPDMPVIIMGDLNENHDEFYRRSGRVISALLPDDPDAAELADLSGTAGDFLIISGEKPPRPSYFSGVPVFYSPWGHELQEGSYYYKDQWETIDHFLLNGPLFDLRDWEFDACMLMNTEPFTGARGMPQAYNPRTGYGLSDHLPLMLILKYTK